MDDKDIEFFKTFTLVLVALAVIGGIAMYVANQIVGDEKKGPLYTEKAVAERIAPAGNIRQSGDPAPVMAKAEKAEAAAPQSPAEIVTASCASCHASGVLGAPKLDDKAAWESRLAQGMDVLVEHAVKGFKGMPAKGGAAHLSDDEVKSAVESILQGVGLMEAKAAAASAPAAAPAAAAPVVAAAPAVDGDKVYKTYCAACHVAGVAGAPKTGDKAAWDARMAQGMDTVMKNAINGIRGMPPKGTCMGCSDDELKAAIDVMTGG